MGVSLCISLYQTSSCYRFPSLLLHLTDRQSCVLLTLGRKTSWASKKKLPCARHSQIASQAAFPIAGRVLRPPTAFFPSSRSSHNRLTGPGRIGTARVAIEVRVLRIVTISSATSPGPEFSFPLLPLVSPITPERISEHDGHHRPLCLAVLLLKGDNLQDFSWPATCSAPTFFSEPLLETRS